MLGSHCEQVHCSRQSFLYITTGFNFIYAKKELKLELYIVNPGLIIATAGLVLNSNARGLILSAFLRIKSVNPSLLFAPSW